MSHDTSVHCVRMLDHGSPPAPAAGAAPLPDRRYRPHSTTHGMRIPAVTLSCRSRRGVPRRRRCRAAWPQRGPDRRDTPDRRKTQRRTRRGDHTVHAFYTTPNRRASVGSALPHTHTPSSREESINLVAREPLDVHTSHHGPCPSAPTIMACAEPAGKAGKVS